MLSLTDDGKVLISKQCSTPRINTVLTPSYSHIKALNPEKGKQIHEDKKEHTPGEILFKFLFISKVLEDFLKSIFRTSHS